MTLEMAERLENMQRALTASQGSCIEMQQKIDVLELAVKNKDLELEFHQEKAAEYRGLLRVLRVLGKCSY